MVEDSDREDLLGTLLPHNVRVQVLYQLEVPRRQAEPQADSEIGQDLSRTTEHEPVPVWIRRRLPIVGVLVRVLAVPDHILIAA